MKARLCSVRAALRKLGREPDARARLREWLAVFEDMGEDERAAEGRAELLGVATRHGHATRAISRI